jgi:uncharacterized membrane protein
MPTVPPVHAPPDRPSQPNSAADLTRRNVERVMALEASEHEKATTADRVADAIAAFSGSIRFVWITVALIGGWIAGNLVLPQHDRVDPFPFPLLTLVLSVEAIFLSIFILMSQNRAAKVGDKRGHLDLQLNMLTEQENTKMLRMLEDIGRVVGAEFCSGPDVEVLAEATQPEALSRQIDQAAAAVETERDGTDAGQRGSGRQNSHRAG